MGTFFVLDFRQRPLRKGKWKATKHVLRAATGFPENGKKPLYQKCIDKMVAKESQEYLKDLLSSFKKEIQSTMAPLRSAIKKLEAPSSIKDTNSLLKAIANTLGIKEHKSAELTIHDKMYKELQPRKPSTFPVPKTLKDIFKKKKSVKTQRRNSSCQPQSNADPFSETDTKTWAKCPKVDASLAKVTNKSDLAFDNAGTLRDPMEIRQ
ncbi:hypothetical protein AB205_0024670 [Aquarana catesbeiana]|uniref:Uncharacterized protein n=1 Tax=Aquarana catesbeiana TaxID=8400 RepID=A0A2G9Q8G1_AQUCT|nr:hypothetical protein AB205_0024670 [Aquarana catesbeiana]